MNNETIYKLNWQYDYWGDIEKCFPKGCKVTAVVNKVTYNYAFLITAEGIICYLYKGKISSPWIVKDLTEVITLRESLNCTVADYDFEKKRLIVSLNLN
mgnify:CR=1 FL=1